MSERIKELAELAKFSIDVSNDPNSPPSWWAAETVEEAAEFERDLFDQLGSKDEDSCIDTRKEKT